MALTVDYYFTPQSPYMYLGHVRFVDMTRRHGAVVRVLPIDLGGKVFPVSGGLPLPKRAPQRQAYRLVELTRFRDWLKMPLNLAPRHFPVAGDDAARLIIAVQQHDGVDAALALSGAIASAVWAEERNIADPAVLAELLTQHQLPAERLQQAQAPEVQAAYDANTQAAITAGVFGAPTYAIAGELFWGQDRLDFVERRLQAG